MTMCGILHKNEYLTCLLWINSSCPWIFILLSVPSFNKATMANHGSKMNTFLAIGSSRTVVLNLPNAVTL